ncbi:hypothetical protein A4X06_0g8746, partial [Tilletia controversa]
GCALDDRLVIQASNTGASRRPRHSSRSDALRLLTAATAVITFGNQAQHWLNKDAFQYGPRVVRISTRACSVCVLPPCVFKMADSIDSLLPHDHHHQHRTTTSNNTTPTPTAPRNITHYQQHHTNTNTNSSNSTATTASSDKTSGAYMLPN